MAKENRVAIVTGGTKGIGKEITLAFARSGIRVVATTRSPSETKLLDEIEKDIRNLITIDRLDLCDSESIAPFVDGVAERFGKIDILVNNAGYALFAPLELAAEDDVKKQFQVNVFGALSMAQAVIPYMRQQQGGYMINISSVGGVVSNPCLGAYSATKHAIEALSASLAATLFPWNIKVSVVEPAMVATGFSEHLVEGKLEKGHPYEKMLASFRKNFDEKISQAQDPKEVAAVVAGIIHEENPHLRYQTGQRSREIVANFVTDPTGDRWLIDQKEQLKNCFFD